MPMPEGGQLNPSGYVPLLVTIAGGMLPTFTEFIADKVAPTVPVGAPTGLYNVWKRGDFMRRGGKRLANYEAAPIEGFATKSGTYSVDNWGVATMWTARDLAEARRGGTQDADFINAKVRFVTWKAALEREIAVATMCQTTGNWSTTLAGIAGAPGGGQFRQWTDAASDPVQDIVLQTEALRLSGGMAPNTIIIPIQVMNALKTNPNLLNRIVYGGTMSNPTEISFDMIKQLFGIENFLIPKGVYNTAAEGQNDALTYIWGKTIWLGYVAPQASNQLPSALYNFAWTGDTSQGLPTGMAAGAGPQAWDANPDATVAGLFMRRYRENRPSGEFLESELWITPNVVGPEMAMTFTAPIP